MNDLVREEWLKSRQGGVGASDVAIILGLSSFKTPYQLYLEKRGEYPASPETPEQRRGKMLEPYVIAMYEDETGRNVIRQQEHVIDGWKMATLDGYDQIKSAPVEAKTVHQFAAGDFGDSYTDDIPLTYAAQVHWQMMMTQSSHGYLAALIGIDDFRIYELNRDDDLESVLIRRCEKFWQMVLDGTPPDPICMDDIALMHPKSTMPGIKATQELEVLFSYLKQQKQDIKYLETQVEKTVLQIKEFMGDNGILLGCDDKPIATWKSSKDTVKTDWESVAKELSAPLELIAKYTETKLGSRRFLIKGEK